MSYLSIIPLADAKVYLRIDDTLTEDDAQITRMINAALSYVEQKTNYILFAREKTFNFVSNAVRVYDYPINSVVEPIEVDSELKTLYTNYCSSADQLILDVGFDNVDEIPQELIEVAYEIIDLYYYGKETGKTIADLSPMSKDALNVYKRFIL